MVLRQPEAADGGIVVPALAPAKSAVNPFGGGCDGEVIVPSPAPGKKSPLIPQPSHIDEPNMVLRQPEAADGEKVVLALAPATSAISPFGGGHEAPAKSAVNPFGGGRDGEVIVPSPAPAKSAINPFGGGRGRSSALGPGRKKNLTNPFGK